MSTYTGTSPMDCVYKCKGVDALIQYIKEKNERMQRHMVEYIEFINESFEFEEYLLESYGGWFV